MDIYFLRHAESTFNQDPKNDFIDCPLTSVGNQEANQIDFSLIICSPLCRCLETLKYSKLTSNQFEIDDLFREIHSGCQSDLLNKNENILIENEQDLK